LRKIKKGLILYRASIIIHHSFFYSKKYYEDGLHVALATIAQADVLVSWNFRHIVRFEKIRLFNAANLEHGYKPLQIFSPREVASDDSEDD
jgi:hypothetical protein